MGNSPHILDYAQRPPRARVKKWGRRIGLLLLIAASLYASLLGWIYIRWTREQPVAEMVSRLRGKIVMGSSQVRPDLVDRLAPSLLWRIGDRIMAVDLDNSAVTDDDLLTLQRATRLEMVLLMDARVTDAGIMHLKNLPGLQILDLGGTGLTDAGLVHLSGLKGLLCLYLGGTKVTDAGVADLQKALPNCYIMR